MVSRAVTEISVVVDIEQSDFGAAPLITVTNHRNGIFRHQHLVVPGIARIDVRSKGVNSGNWFQRVTANGHCEQAASAKHDQMIAMQLDDAAFIYAGVLNVGD